MLEQVVVEQGIAPEPLVTVVTEAVLSLALFAKRTLNLYAYSTVLEDFIVKFPQIRTS